MSMAVYSIVTGNNLPAFVMPAPHQMRGRLARHETLMLDIASDGFRLSPE